MSRHLAREGGSDTQMFLDELPRMTARELVGSFDNFGGKFSSNRTAINSLRSMAALKYAHSMADGEYRQAELYALALSVMPFDYTASIRRAREERMAYIGLGVIPPLDNLVEIR